MAKYDVVVLGCGVGGYPVAIKLVQKGYRVAVVEEDQVGGECTNYGCVPSKALYYIARSIEGLSRVVSEKASIDPGLLIEWVKSRVMRARDGITYLLERYGVDLYHGHGVVGDRVVKLVSEKSVLETDYVVLATGTDPLVPRGIGVDGEYVVTNREVFYMEPPGSLLVVGAGAIGVELAYSYSMLGVDVYVVEAMPRILPFLDRDVSVSLERFLREKGVRFYKNTLVTKTVRKNGFVEAVLSSGERVVVNRVVVAVGRRPRTTGIGVEELGVRLDSKGYVELSRAYYTSVPWILASGDITGPPLLAHKAFLDALGVVESIVSGKAVKPKPESIPLTIFSGLEVASIGYTEEELRRRGVEYRRIRMPIAYLSAVSIKGGEYGFVKVLVGREDSVYGVHLVAPNASEVVSSFIPYYIGVLGFSDAKHIAYPHLTVSEVVREFAEYLLGEPVHLYIRK